MSRLDLGEADGPPIAKANMSCLILVVEDDPDIREVIAEVLGARGYDVRSVADGLEAWSLMHGSGVRPDVVLLDLMMPRMDGRTLLTCMAKKPSLFRIPVIVTTAQKIGVDHVVRTADEVLQKPYPLARLLAVVEKLRTEVSARCLASASADQ